MTDDFFDPNNPNQDCHSCNLQNPESPCPAPNMRTLWYRIPEVFADQTAGNKLSAIRWLIMIIALCVFLYTLNIVLSGHCEPSFWPSVAAMVGSVMAGYSIGKWFKKE